MYSKIIDIKGLIQDIGSHLLIYKLLPRFTLLGTGVLGTFNLIDAMTKHFNKNQEHDAYIEANCK